MKEGQRLWTRDELMLAINLYSKLPFGKMHSRNADIQQLAAIFNRTPSSVARKLGNFASFDPKLQERGIKGLANTSKLDKEIWNEFAEHWDELFIESEKQLAKHEGITVESKYEYETPVSYAGEEVMRSVMVRLNQTVFRKIVLSNFDNKCCITGIDKPELLVAGHILPWSLDKGNRLNPRNGLLLSTLHDKAFECGLLTIEENYKIKISSKLKTGNTVKSIENNFIQFDGKSIMLPKKFLPSQEFLKAHINIRFKP
jgi:putative restriction endonuclease